MTYTAQEIQTVFPNVIDLKLNLYEEDHVDYIMKVMPQLQYLNGLPVEREDEEGSQAEEEMNEEEYQFEKGFEVE